MTIEQWHQWMPTNNISDRYNIVEICNKQSGFVITCASFHDKNKQVIITFENSVASYTYTDESFKVSVIQELNERYGKEFYGDWTFFKILNSCYIKKLSEQSYGFADALSCIHFAFIDSNSILDVIATYEPQVHVITL